MLQRHLRDALDACIAQSSLPAEGPASTTRGFVIVRRLGIILSAGLLAAAVFVGPASAGNGAPQGNPDYQLNIIGTSDKNPNMTGGNGARIFVDLYGASRIALYEGPYAVLDADGWASFQLPKPGLDAFIVGDPGDADVESEYSVFIRPLGKPGGWATMTTCADVLDSSFGGLIGNKETNLIENAIDEETGAFCSIEQVGADILTRTKGKSTFTNVTAQLLTIVFEVTVETSPGVFETFQVRVPIFDDSLENEYWLYDNNGLRLAQVRFYDCSTNVATGESTC